MFGIPKTKRDWLLVQINTLQEQGISKAEIARRLQIKPQQLNNILNSSRNVTDKFLDDFMKAFNINQISLYSQLLPDPTANSIYKRILEIFNDVGISVNDFLEINKDWKGVFDYALHWDDPKTAKGWATLVAHIYPSYSLDWILTGNGEMKTMHAINNSGVIINGNNSDSPIDNRHYYSDSPDVLRARIESLDKEMSDKIKIYEERIKEKDAQIKEKDAQIKEKDAQIKDLLDILKKK